MGSYDEERRGLNRRKYLVFDVGVLLFLFWSRKHYMSRQNILVVTLEDVCFVMGGDESLLF